jgi:hypothetical protein
VIFDLRAVERALARQLFPGNTAGLQRFAHALLGLVPGFFRTQTFSGRSASLIDTLSKPKRSYTSITRR